VNTIPAKTSLMQKLSLWPHQTEAVSRMTDYIEEYQAGAATGSALVHMPTGSGKTGVIATLSRCLPCTGCVLVLTPRVALRQQIVRDMRGRFFQRLDSAPELSDIPKQVFELDGASGDLTPDNIEQTVFVATIQKLRSMTKRASPILQQLKRHVSLVMFDEGHYEPAPTWSESARQFEAPKIVFTATPYRNDLKVFDLNPEYAYSYTYHAAIRDHYLREVEFIPCEATYDPTQFVQDVLDFYDERFGQEPEPPRVIIRCDDKTTIRQIASLLEHHGRTHVAIHERFSDAGGDTRERRTVPDPDTETATFWIHQFKLLEGIDDPRFQVLALFQPLVSARPLIQQIGRIIRNPHLHPSVKGYVLDHSPGGLHRELWEGFLNYDRVIDEGGSGALNLTLGHGRASRIAAAMPGPAYLGGRFRVPLDLDALQPSDDIALPLHVNLLYKLDDFDLDRCRDILAQEYVGQDRWLRTYTPDETTVVFVYVAFANSRYLRTASFFEPSLGVTVIHELDQMIAFYDTQGYVPLNHDRARIGKAVDAAKLKKLFRQHGSSYLTRVSLQNTNLATRAVRSHSLSAAVVRDTVSGFDDHAQVCATATGYSIDNPSRPSEKTRRYVGFKRGRISQPSADWCSLGDYLGWLKDLQFMVEGQTRSLPTFRRYAPEEADVRDPTPAHILLDLSEVENTYATLPWRGARAGRPLQIEDLSCEVQDGRFQLLANGVPCSVRIAYNGLKRRYELDSADLDSLYANKSQFQPRGIVQYLNQEQSFRIVPKSTNVIYALGQFYKPVFKVGREFDPDQFEVSRILFPCPELEDVAAEKGATIHGDPDGWDPASLFGLVDHLGASTLLAGYFGNPDILVCDDGGTEIADFILSDTGQRQERIVLIHAKASPQRRPYSASALQEVCGQATKNINYSGMYNEQTPRNLRRWEGPWRSADSPRVRRRIRRGPASAEELWSALQRVIRHPLAEREIWLILGRTLSKREFEDRLGRAHPTPEAVQAAFLLHATMTNVQSIGARLRVFCYP
jgi:superfamily II DNA or RNA helicase